MGEVREVQVGRGQPVEVELGQTARLVRGRQDVQPGRRAAVLVQQRAQRDPDVALGVVQPRDVREARRRDGQVLDDATQPEVVRPELPALPQPDPAGAGHGVRVRRRIRVEVPQHEVGRRADGPRAQVSEPGPESAVSLRPDADHDRRRAARAAERDVGGTRRVGREVDARAGAPRALVDQVRRVLAGGEPGRGDGHLGHDAVGLRDGDRAARDPVSGRGLGEEPDVVDPALELGWQPLLAACRDGEHGARQGQMICATHHRPLPGAKLKPAENLRLWITSSSGGGGGSGFGNRSSRSKRSERESASRSNPV